MSEEKWRSLNGRGRLYGLWDGGLSDGGLTDQEIGVAEMLLRERNLDLDYVSSLSRKAATAQVKALLAGRVHTEHLRSAARMGL